jgi:hypothetical protein
MGLSETDPSRGHEEKDVNFNVIVLFAASLVVALVVVHFLSVRVFDTLAKRSSKYPPPSPLAASRTQFIGPRLQVNQALEMKKLRASEDALLKSYGWVDRDHGVVRIPIERAIELVAETDRGSKIEDGGSQ